MKVRNKDVRVISGYGPQESWTENERMPFFIALEKEIIKAQMDGKSIIIEMDSNSKLGPEVIANDPHGQSPNGKILCDIITRHGLIVANGISDKCEGSITRRRVTKDTIEESIIDHVIISEDLVSELDSLKIDEKQEHVLTKYTKTKAGVKKTKSDHNVLFTNFKMNWNSKVKSALIEMFNLKNKSCQLMFKECF